jgi:hypothetical protein
MPRHVRGLHDPASQEEIQGFLIGWTNRLQGVGPYALRASARSRELLPVQLPRLPRTPAELDEEHRAVVEQVDQAIQVGRLHPFYRDRTIKAWVARGRRRQTAHSPWTCGRALRPCAGTFGCIVAVGRLQLPVGLDAQPHPTSER